MHHESDDLFRFCIFHSASKHKKHQTTWDAVGAIEIDVPLVNNPWSGERNGIDAVVHRKLPKWPDNALRHVTDNWEPQ